MADRKKEVGKSSKQQSTAVQNDNKSNSDMDAVWRRIAKQADKKKIKTSDNEKRARKDVPTATDRIVSSMGGQTSRDANSDGMFVTTSAAARASRKHKARKKLSKKALAIRIVVSIVAIVVVVVVCYALNVGDMQYWSVNFDSLDDASNYALDNPDLYEKSVWWLVKNAKATSNKTEKASYYLEAAKVITGLPDPTEDQLKEAIKYAKEAEKLKPTGETASLLADVYSMIGDEDTYNMYYNLATDRGYFNDND